MKQTLQTKTGGTLSSTSFSTKSGGALSSTSFSTKSGAGFTLIEMLVVIAIIGILSSLGLSSFTSAQKKARDARRKNDLTTIAKALEVYNNDHSSTFPYPDDDGAGQIKGCTTLADPTETACTWGSSFQHADTTPATVYLITLPQDSTTNQTYYYEAAADRKSYQLYARLENTADPAVPKDVNNSPLVYSGTDCGDGIICNYGISSSNTTPATGHPPLPSDF